MAGKDYKLQIIIDAENRAKSALSAVGGDLESVNGKLKAAAPAFKAMAGAGTAAFAGIVAGVGLSLKAYAESEAALTRVDQSIKNTIALVGGSFEELSQGARDFGTQLQKLAGFSDEAGAEGFAKMLVVAGGDAMEATKLANLAADLSIAKQIDYGSAVKAVALAQTGNVKVLKEYGIVLDDNATKEEVTAALLATVGGQAKAFGSTMEGQAKIMSESFGELQEMIGKSFTPILQQVLDVVKPILEKIMEWVEANPELTRNIILVAGAVAALVAGLGFLGLVLPVVITGFALMTGPIGLVVLAIAAVIAITVVLVKNWDKIKAYFKETWEGIKIIFGEAVDSVMAKLQPLLDFLKKVQDAIQNTINKAKSVATGAFSSVGNFFTGKASGGSVLGGTPYIVGERGPEMFVPGASGTIIPNNKLGGGTINIYITGNEFMGEEGIAEKIGKALMQVLKQNVRIA